MIAKVIYHVIKNDLWISIVDTTIILYHKTLSWFVNQQTLGGAASGPCSVVRCIFSGVPPPGCEYQTGLASRVCDVATRMLRHFS